MTPIPPDGSLVVTRSTSSCAQGRRRPTGIGRAGVPDGIRRAVAGVIVAAGALLAAARPAAAQISGIPALPPLHHPADPAAWRTFASGDEVLTLQADPRDANRLWAGTESAGVVVWDALAGTFAQFAAPAQAGLPSNRVYDIAFDPAGTAWLATAGGVVRADGTALVRAGGPELGADGGQRGDALAAQPVLGPVPVPVLAVEPIKAAQPRAGPEGPVPRVGGQRRDLLGLRPVVRVPARSDGCDVMPRPFPRVVVRHGGPILVHPVAAVGEPDPAAAVDQAGDRTAGAGALLAGAREARERVARGDRETIVAGRHAGDAGVAAGPYRPVRLDDDGPHDVRRQAVGHVPAGPHRAVGTSRWDGARWTTAAAAAGAPAITAIAGAAGRVWFAADGMSNDGSGDGSGIATRDGGPARVLSTAGGTPATNDVTALAIDGRGGLWAGTRGHGLLHYDGRTWTRQTRATTGGRLAGDAITDLAVGTDTLWVASTKSTYDGSAWVDGGVSALDVRTLQWQPPLRHGSSELPDNDVGSVLVAPDGRLWIGLGASPDGPGASGTTSRGNGIAIYDPRTKGWEDHTYDSTSRALVGNTVLDLAAGPNGIWAAASHHLDPETESRVGGGVTRAVDRTFGGWTGGRDGLDSYHGSSFGRDPQVTGDMRSFWANTYPEVRKELKRRYPRHAWPEDPWTAPPEHRPARRRRG